MNAPIRSRVSPMTIGVMPAALSRSATDRSSSQVVGTSSSVSPACAHRSVLICMAMVEKSFGMQ
ncbi:hypothetical protein D3C83_246500 [compost metagenome]